MQLNATNRLVRSQKENTSALRFSNCCVDAAARRFDFLFLLVPTDSQESVPWPLSSTWKLLESYDIRWKGLAEPWIDSAGAFHDVIIRRWPVSPNKNEFGSQNEFLLAHASEAGVEHEAEGPSTGCGRCSNAIGLLSFDARDSLGAKSR